MTFSSKPTADMLDFALSKTLVWVNGRRNLDDRAPLDELPPGIECDGVCCPVALATNAGFVDMNRWQPKRGDPWQALPPYVRAFLRYFDNDKYPSLIDPC